MDGFSENYIDKVCSKTCNIRARILIGSLSLWPAVVAAVFSSFLLPQMGCDGMCIMSFSGSTFQSRHISREVVTTLLVR